MNSVVGAESATGMAKSSTCKFSALATATRATARPKKILDVMVVVVR